MANILVATTPLDGHVNPVFQVIKELVSRNHNVWWYTGKKYKKKSETIGARFCPMKNANDFSMKTLEEAFPEARRTPGLAGYKASMKAIFFDNAAGQMTDILDLLKVQNTDIIIADELCYGAGLAREKTGVPIVTVATSVYILKSKDTAPFGLAKLPDNSFKGRLRNLIMHTMADNFIFGDSRKHTNKLRTDIGLPILNRSLLENVTDSPNLYLLGTVPSFEYPRSDLYKNTHFVGPFFGAPQEEFTPPSWWNDLNEDRPVIHVTQGTISTEADNLIVPTIRALAKEDVLVVVSTGGAPIESIKIDHIPDNVRIEKFIPHYHLLPHVDVMITNGGYGGVQTALSNGVPLIIAGATEEKPEVAAHVAYGSFGIDLKVNTPTADQLLKAVKEILKNPTYKNKARALQSEYKNYNGPKLSVDLIEKLLCDSANNIMEGVV
jgi:MGT family glycosyltransferase